MHRNISCDICGASPLKGTRFKVSLQCLFNFCSLIRSVVLQCANCVDYDVCENCEPRDHHHPAHVFVQIKRPIPPLLNAKRPLLQPFYPGNKHVLGGGGGAGNLYILVMA